MNPHRHSETQRTQTLLTGTAVGDPHPDCPHMGDRQGVF